MSLPITGADILCDTLLANEINVCFANPGTSEMHFVAALDRKPAMRCVLGLSETVVTGAADGYYRMAGKPASTLLHTGPGLANGLANLHNAKRAFTGMVNVVGDHADYHLAYDAPLTSDIESLAKPMSNWVGRSLSTDDVYRAASEAIAHAYTPPGNIATLILPANHAWGEAKEIRVLQAAARAKAKAPEQAGLEAALAVLQNPNCNATNTTILLAGGALREGAMALASRIAEKTGARLLAQQANARVQRGMGRVMLDRAPYVVDKAVEVFASTQHLILIGAKSPVGFFAYPGKPSSMVPDGCKVIKACTLQDDAMACLERLCEGLGITPGMRASQNMLASHHNQPKLSAPEGTLTAATIAQSVVMLMPDQTVLVDESVSSGREFFPMSYHAAPHDYLQITGGAIGCGIPIATGAAIASPGRKVITMQADGSAMYSLQGLWTQAREKLDVITIIFSNRRYNILLGELKSVGANTAIGANAKSMLYLDQPELQWVKLANGMGVEGARAQTAEQFHDLLKSAIGTKGPFLIEAMI